MFRDINYDEVVASQESNILYPMFYRRHGVRRAVQLVAPPLSKLALLDLPRGSILHYVTEDESQYGLPQDDPLLRTQTKLIMVEHMTTLGDDKGPPRPTFLPANPLIRDYHRKNRQTRLMLRPEISMRDERTLVMENYAILPHLYRYAATYFANYYKWWNIQTRLWQRVGEMSKYQDRQQYLVCQLPEILPTLGTLKRAESGMTRPVLDRVSDSRSWFIVELWKWLGNNRSESALSKSKPEELRNMNLIWLESGRWFTVNLGMLDDWRKPGKNDPERPDLPGIIEPEQMQRRFLRMLMVLSEARTVAESPVTQIEETQVEGQNETTATTDAPAEAEADVGTQPITIKVKGEDDKTRNVKLTSGMDVDRLPEEPVEETDENIALIDKQIQAELEAIDKLFDERRKADTTAAAEVDPNAPTSQGQSQEDRDPDMIGQAPIKYEAEPRTYEKSIMAKVDAYADDGQISAAEYRRFTTLATAYQNLPNPYGEGTLAEHAEIQPEELALDNKPQIPDITAVSDKSMLKSTLFEFDSKYLEEIYSKDFVAMLLNLQHAGYAVTGYSVETFEDASGKFQIHKVQVTPVRGKPTTLEIRVPVPEADGTFRTNGVRYRLRKQRADVPIRKVSPAKVALTSYYSKVFVLRSEKQANNYPGWLTNQIVLRDADPADQSVISLMVSNVFDPAVRTPRVYSIMAARFRSFFINDYELFFDFHARRAQFGEERVDAAEEGGKLIVCGRRHGRLLLMDWNNVIYQLNGEDLVPAGTIESLLDINGRRPIERAEIKVFNKLIPVGVFLGYQLGLTQLLELLKVRYRRVPSGQRLNMADDEYALRFVDESLVFTQDNRAATLILAGFLQFDKWLRNYPIGLFDKKDIYLNILENEKIGMRYLREMDLMVDLFVDPITLEILQEMKEPETFIGLVFRSCELLESDWSPAETDMAYQRIRGYERWPGMVYQEMVKAIRVHRSRGTSAAKVELNPFAVWQTIHQDPAVKVVEESNPIHNLKEMEEVTYAGVGGRGDRSMVGHTRRFHENDMGVISEATKDSAQVAITTFLTADPNLTSLRGLTKPYEEGETGAASLLSTSALLAPASDRDDQ